MQSENVLDNVVFIDFEKKEQDDLMVKVLKLQASLARLNRLMEELKKG